MKLSEMLKPRYWCWYFLRFEVNLPERVLLGCFIARGGVIYWISVVFWASWTRWVILDLRKYISLVYSWLYNNKKNNVYLYLHRREKLMQNPHRSHLLLWCRVHHRRRTTQKEDLELHMERGREQRVCPLPPRKYWVVCQQGIPQVKEGLQTAQPEDQITHHWSGEEPPPEDAPQIQKRRGNHWTFARLQEVEEA